jgi:RNA polymerase sigma-54 factor
MARILHLALLAHCIYTPSGLGRFFAETRPGGAKRKVEMAIIQRAQPRIRQATTAHLTQTMSLLELSRAELNEWLNSSLASNPALEVVEPESCPSCHRPLYQPGPCPVCHPAKEEPIVFLSTPPSRKTFSDADENLPEPAQPETLTDYLMRQIGPELSAEERPIAQYLLARLDDNGLMPEPPLESARFLHVSPAAVENVLHTIQRCDPPGVGALSTVDALLIQIDTLTEAGAVPAGVREIVRNHLEELAHGEFAAIAKALHLSRGAVEAAAHFIKVNLTPYPGRTFFHTGPARAESDPDLYREAEMTFRVQPNNPDGPLVVEVYAPLAGRVRVNPEFRQMVRTLSGEEREKWNEKVEEALLIDKCLRQSQNTLMRLAASLAEEQRAFILGTDRELRPLTRAELARRLGVHESTVSRAVSNKRAALPSGRIVPISRFFDRSLSVRDMVRSIVSDEPKALSDTEIVSLLEEQGVHIARRTVAKYRAMEGILPMSLRRTQHAHTRPAT